MPLIHYLCSCKQRVSKFYRQAKDAPAGFLCESCGQDMKKQLSAPSNVSKVVIDNGFQAKAIEVVPEIVEINKERSNRKFKEES